MTQTSTAATAAPEAKTYPPASAFAAQAHIDAAKYEEMYQASISDPEAFWGEHGKIID